MFCWEFINVIYGKTSLIQATLPLEELAVHLLLYSRGQQTFFFCKKQVNKYFRLCNPRDKNWRYYVHMYGKIKQISTQFFNEILKHSNNWEQFCLLMRRMEFGGLITFCMNGVQY